MLTPGCPVPSRSRYQPTARGRYGAAMVTGGDVAWSGVSAPGWPGMAAWAIAAGPDR
jgi:hypothetical protein